MNTLVYTPGGTTKKSYQEVIGNLNIENFKSSLYKKLPTY